jgi:hypothetical protein
MSDPLQFSYRKFQTTRQLDVIFETQNVDYNGILKWLMKTNPSVMIKDDALEICRALWNVFPDARGKIAEVALSCMAETFDADLETAEQLLAFVPDGEPQVRAKAALQRIRAVKRSKQSYAFQTRYQAKDVRRLKQLLSKNREFKPVPQDTVFTCIGSCFATYIASALTQRGLPDVRLFSYQDNAHPLSVLSHVLQDSQFEKRIKGAHNTAVILTAGFAETGDPTDPVGAGSLNRFLTPEAVAATIAELAHTLKSWNPSCRFFATVSPVPLVGSNSGLNAFEANAVSKSIMRLGMELARNRADSIEYFPSYELVTQYLPGLGVGPFGIDDGNPLHVNKDVVRFVTDLFIDFYLPAIDLNAEPSAPEAVSVSKFYKMKGLDLQEGPQVQDAAS